MEIKKIRDGEKLTVELTGRLDAVTAMEFDKTLSQELAGITTLTLDLANLEYIASAGLRILLKLQKRMSGQGKMTVKNLQNPVREVIEMSGFSRILMIEDDKKSRFEFSIAGDYNDSEVFKL